MSSIDICVIGRRTPDFTEQLNIIRHIDGLKVLKRRNKPFYDITGAITNDGDLSAMADAIKYMLVHCGAELEIKDDELRQIVLDLVK